MGGPARVQRTAGPAVAGRGRFAPPPRPRAAPQPSQVAARWRWGGTFRVRRPAPVRPWPLSAPSSSFTDSGENNIGQGIERRIG